MLEWMGERMIPKRLKPKKEPFHVNQLTPSNE